ncbi:AraC family transcriptional regulator, partial [Escherichia coli]|uniref:helix-turn-helix domain-containing protein n=1 Tax=Escherichia coli TaxID=562 RepID=UPI003C2EC4B3
GKNSLNRLIRCVCGKKIGPDPRNFNQRVSLGRNDLLIRTFPKVCGYASVSYFTYVFRRYFGVSPSQYSQRSSESKILTHQGI